MKEFSFKISTIFPNINLNDNFTIKYKIACKIIMFSHLFGITSHKSSKLKLK